MLNTAYRDANIILMWKRQLASKLKISSCSPSLPFGVFTHHCTQYYWYNQCKISWSSILLHPPTLINVSPHNQWWTSLFHKPSVIGRQHLKVVIKLRWQQESRYDNIHGHNTACHVWPCHALIGSNAWSDE